MFSKNLDILDKLLVCHWWLLTPSRKKDGRKFLLFLKSTKTAFFNPLKRTISTPVLFTRTPPGHAYVLLVSLNNKGTVRTSSISNPRTLSNCHANTLMTAPIEGCINTFLTHIKIIIAFSCSSSDIFSSIPCRAETIDRKCGRSRMFWPNFTVKLYSWGKYDIELYSVISQ